MSNRSGIEIDYCSTCRGIWLDRGELDKIIERSEQPQTSPSNSRPVQYEDSNHHETTYRSDSGHPSHKKKRNSFIGDLFDF